MINYIPNTVEIEFLFKEKCGHLLARAPGYLAPRKAKALRLHQAELNAKRYASERELHTFLKNNGFPNFLKNEPLCNRWWGDVVFPDKGIVVEIDGSHHKEEVQAAKDVFRDECLHAFGYKVLRVDYTCRAKCLQGLTAALTLLRETTDQQDWCAAIHKGIQRTRASSIMEARLLPTPEQRCARNLRLADRRANRKTRKSRGRMSLEERRQRKKKRKKARTQHPVKNSAPAADSVQRQHNAQAVEALKARQAAFEEQLRLKKRAGQRFGSPALQLYRKKEKKGLRRTHEKN